MDAYEIVAFLLIFGFRKKLTCEPIFNSDLKQTARAVLRFAGTFGVIVLPWALIPATAFDGIRKK
jgi:hypothetical protein